MFGRLLAILSSALVIAFSPLPSSAQSIDLGIINIAQEGQAWCWAAAAQQVVAWKTGRAPYQCEMVAVANGVHPAVCCPYNPQCDVPGSMQQIQFLIANYGMSYSQITPPTDPMTLFALLQRRSAVIMFVRNSPYAQIGHFVVLRGMAWTHAGPVVLINDPIGWPGFSQPMPFQALIGYWQAAIVVD